MARGSSLEERPGVSPTEVSRFDPSDLKGSFREFEKKVFQVLGHDPDMGVLLCPMVGGLHTFSDHVTAFGWENVSFVADSHHPMIPKDLHFAVVQGWGTRAVRAGSDAILISADRHFGWITSFIHKTEEAFLRPYHAAAPCLRGEDYSQKQAEFVDMATGLPASRRLEDRFFSSFRWDPLLGDSVTEFPRIFFGRLIRKEDEVDSETQQAFLETPGVYHEETQIGANPFQEGRMLTSLIGILQFFSREVGPVQIEGAFPHGSAEKPFLYQLTEMPEPFSRRTGLRLRKKHFSSDMVLGVVEFFGPLLMARSDDLEPLRELDERFAGSGYTLLVPGHTGPVMEATPHCRLRLSTSRENLGSHSVSLTRLKIHENPEDGYFLATKVKLHGAEEGRIRGKAPEEYRGVQIFPRVHLDSNGVEMGVEIL